MELEANRKRGASYLGLLDIASFISVVYITAIVRPSISGVTGGFKPQYVGRACAWNV